jgi:hypothetical protein
VKVRTHDSYGNIKNEQVIQSNDGTSVDVTSWNSLPAVGDIYTIGAIPMERFSKCTNNGYPSNVKVPVTFHVTFENAGVTRKLKVRHYVDGSATPFSAAGKDIDVGVGIDKSIPLKARGKLNQIKLENLFADEPITIKDWERKVLLGGNK